MDELDELIDAFGSQDAFTEFTGLQLARIQALREHPANVTEVERAFLRVLLRAHRAQLLDFLKNDVVLVGLEEPERSAPAGLVTLTNVLLYNLLEFQHGVIEVQRLIIDYYQQERSSGDTVKGEGSETV